MRGTWQTTSSGGGGGAIMAVAVVFVAAIAVSIAGQVIHAVVSIVETALIIVGALAGLGLAGGIALVVYRVRRNHANVTRPVPWESLAPPRATERLTVPRQAPALEQPTVVHQHLHFHGMTPQEASAVIRQQGSPVLPVTERDL